MISAIAKAGAIAALLAAIPAAAATKIECVKGGYSAADTALFDDFVSKGMDKGDMKAIVAPIAARAQACATENSWPAEAIIHALFYQMAALAERSVIAAPELSSADMAKMETLYTKKRVRLRQLLGPMIEAQMTGQQTSMPKSSEVELGLMIITGGLPADDKSATYVGKVIGARMMGEISAEKFSKL